MPKRASNQPATPPAASAPDSVKRPTGFDTAVERCTVLHLRNPYLWLVAALPLYLSLYLTFLQWRYQGFEHLELMSHLTMAIEGGIVCSTLVLAYSSMLMGPQWLRLVKDLKFNEMAPHVAAALLICLIALVELLPILLFHQYPQLRGPKVDVPINIPLMMLQRTITLVIVALITYNVIIIVRLYLKLLPSFSILIGSLWHIGLGYYLTYLSVQSKVLSPMNDVFYYNQLWHYIAWFPKLQGKTIYHNMQWSIFLFTGIGILIWAVTLLLIYPKAVYSRQVTSSRNM